MMKSLKKPRAHYRWVGATVVTRQELSNSLAELPAGSRGVQVRLTRVRPEMLDIVAYPEVEEGYCGD
ncbi:TPA: hypothetical protein ACS5Y8_002786 [Salmonella enterica]